MATSHASSPRLKQKTVRKRLADGSIKEYVYNQGGGAVTKAPPRLVPGSVEAWAHERRGGKPPPVIETPPRLVPGSISATIAAWQTSPEWRVRKPLTRQNYTFYIKHLDEYGSMPLAELTRRHVLAMRNLVAKDHGMGAATVFKRVVSAFLTWCVDNEHAEVNVASGIKSLGGGHNPAWTVYQADLAEREMPETLSRAVILARYTGLRRSDLIAMRWSQVHANHIHVEISKHKSEDEPISVDIAIHPNLLDHLAVWRVGRSDDDYVLVNEAEHPWRGDNLSTAIGKWMKKHNLTGSRGGALNIHGLRKLACIALAQAGCTPHEIMAVTGHKTLDMVVLYTEEVERTRLAKVAMDKVFNLVSQHLGN
jgi:integrase